ncbi:type VI secretion system protein TssA [Telmatospirillum sp.]|uniref:type VI secretion system protein TssA n=1 Tax=Telmatospirillum sp. TaxID=2079197 RepID=UPI00285111DE|nr:type VI secretion system protein TssA [Telmatospirillum sp.]MDR3435259.1 type VI secretion system protein TssA [Telmatospirillum sp.]
MQMVSPLTDLLRPISDEAPCGVDLRLQPGSDAEYFLLRDLRSSARAIERRADADEEAESSLSEWQHIREMAVALLETRSKDIEIAVWLTEAQVRLGGFAGLHDGFRLISGLVERYWNHLLPMPDEDGMAVRLAPLSGLNGIDTEGTLIQPIRKIPLSPADGGEPPIAFWHYELARRAASAPDARPRPGRTAPPSLDDLRRRMTAAPAEHNRRLIDDIRSCREVFATLDRQLTALCGTEAPPSSTIAHILEEVEDAVVFLAGHRDTPVLSVPTAIESPAEPAAAGPDADVLPPAEGIASREEALLRLDEIGRYFRRTEPHSPLSYTIEDLVRRGRMSLPELLAELLQDQTARHTLLTAAGIRPPAQP